MQLCKVQGAAVAKSPEEGESCAHLGECEEASQQEVKKQFTHKLGKRENRK